MRYKLHIVQGVDLAIKNIDSPDAVVKPDGTVDADYTAIGTVGYSLETMLIYALSGVRKQVSFPKQVELIKSEYRLWRPETISIESVQYQDAMRQHLFATTSLPVEKVDQTDDPIFRVQAMGTHFENGRVRLRGILDPVAGQDALTWHPELDRFVREYKEFPYGDHDDVLTAMLIAISKALEKMEEKVGIKPVMIHRPSSLTGQYGVGL